MLLKSREEFEMQPNLLKTRDELRKYFIDQVKSFEEFMKTFEAPFLTNHKFSSNSF